MKPNKNQKKRKRTIDVVIGGLVDKDEFNIAICPLSDKGPYFELNMLCRKDLEEIKSAIDCALEDFHK